MGRHLRRAADVNGLAEAFVIRRDFVASGRSAFTRGDHLFYGTGLVDPLRRAAERAASATAFGHGVRYPQRYPVVPTGAARSSRSS